MATTTISGRGMAFAFQKQTTAANTGSALTTNKIAIVAQSAQSSLNGYLPPASGQPSMFWIRWLQGSMHYPEGMFNHEWEGDGNRGESLAYKRFQYGKMTHICYPRPVELAYLLQAFAGTGSNTVGALFSQTSVTGTITAGSAATITLTTVTTGSTYSLHIGDVLKITGGGSPTEYLTITNITGRSDATHAVITTTTATQSRTTGYGIANAYYPHQIAYPAVDNGNDYYSIATLLRGSTYGLESFDAILTKLTLSGQVGQPIKVQSEWVAGGNQFYDSTAVPTGSSGALTVQLGGAVYNAAVVNLPTALDGPYYFLAQSIATSLFSFSNLATLNAAVREFTITMETTVNPEDYQGENVFPLPMVVGNVQTNVDLTVLWQDASAISLAYFGTATLANGTPDVTSAGATLTGFGNVQLSFVSSNINNVADPSATFLYELPNASFEATTFEPDLSGKPVEMKITMHGLKGTPTGVYQLGSAGTGLNVPWAAKVRCASPVFF